MIESAFWSQWRPKLSLDVHHCRIENSAMSGMPDVQMTRQGRDVWVELKVAKGRRIDVRHSQVNWMRRRLAAGARNVFLLARYEDHVALYRAETVVSASEVAPSRDDKYVHIVLEPNWTPVWSGFHRIKWAELEEFLFRA